jgi:D-alanyl-D-alanine dipeptidase
VDADPTYDHLSVPAEAVADLVVPAGLPPVPGPVPGAAPAGTVPVHDCGEPLVAVTDLACINSYRAVGWAGTEDAVWVRPRVLERLHAVRAALPDGYGLAIHDGWRSPATVRALYEHYYGPGSTLEPGFLAEPDDPRITPPHVTGGAVDLTLSWQGTALSLGTAFDDFSSRAHLRALEGEPGTSRELRRLLTHAMVTAGFAPNPFEWWHFSFGDQAWAALTGAPAAVHGAVLPDRA